MPRDDSLIPRDLVGELDVLRVESQEIGRERNAKSKVRPHLHVAIFVTVFAISGGVAAPTTAEEPGDPFGAYTVELYKDASLAKMWDSLRGQMLIQKDYFHKCLDSKNCSSPIPEIAKVLDGIRHYQGKALLGHLNLT